MNFLCIKTCSTTVLEMSLSGMQVPAVELQSQRCSCGLFLIQILCILQSKSKITGCLNILHSKRLLYFPRCFFVLKIAMQLWFVSNGPIYTFLSHCFVVKYTHDGKTQSTYNHTTHQTTTISQVVDVLYTCVY